MEEKRIETLETTVKALSGELSALKDLIVESFKKVENNFDVVGKKIDTTSKKVDLNSAKIEALTNKLAGLDLTTTDGFQDVGIKLESLTEEIQKISVVTKYTEEWDNLKGMN